MSISTEAALIAARANARPTSVQKASIANAVAGALYSLWRSTGPLPAAGAIPTSAAVCTQALLGSLWSFTNPTAPVKTYLDWLDIGATVAGSHAVYDRLAHMGGLSGTVTTAQTANVTLPTDANRCDQSGLGVEWYLEWYTDTGSTAVTATISYTNEANTSGRTATVSVGATTRAGRLLPIRPASGDAAIKSVQSVTLSATTGAAGNFGVTARRRLATMTTLSANIAEPKQRSLLVPIPDDACGEIVNECSATTTGDLRGDLLLIQG